MLGSKVLRLIVDRGIPRVPPYNATYLGERDVGGFYQGREFSGLI